MKHCSLCGVDLKPRQLTPLCGDCRRLSADEIALRKKQSDRRWYAENRDAVLVRLRERREKAS